MATYTVKSGDTLSGIASKLGLPSYRSLTGYRSGNPNLIYPGEVLSYGGAAPAPAPSGGGGGGGGNVSQPIFDFAAAYKREQEALLARQKQEQEGLFGQFENQMNSQEKLPTLYRRLQSEAGIPGLSQAVQGYKDEIYRVKGLLDRLDEDVTSRNMGTYTTEAMRRRITQTEGDEMRTTLGRLGTGLEPVADMLKSAQGDVMTMMQLETAEQEQALQPVMLRINALGDRFARELTGFTKSREVELTAILDKLERDRFLSDRDWDLAQKLAAEEREFSRQKTLASMAAASAFKAASTTSGSNFNSGGGGSKVVRALPSAVSSALQVTHNPQVAWGGLQVTGGGGTALNQSSSSRGISLGSVGSGWSLQGGGSGIRLQ